MTGLHVAIIMDGNGRWGAARGLPRVAGHREGARALRRVVEAAPSRGIATLTVYAFSADNWSRPADEVSWLMRLFRRYLRTERDESVRAGVRLSVIGRRDRLPEPLRRQIQSVEQATLTGERLWLRVAMDYSGRDAIVRAAQIAAPDVDRERFARLLTLVDHGPPVLPVWGFQCLLSCFQHCYCQLCFPPCTQVLQAQQQAEQVRPLALPAAAAVVAVAAGWVAAPH